MKKKIVALLGAAALALALPMSAFAAPSPSGTTAVASDGTALTVSGNYSGGALYVEATSETASNMPAGSKVAASFEVTADAAVVIDGELTFVFNVGTQYAGATATVYIEHGDGATETQTVTIAADGTFTMGVDKLSIFTVVVDESTIPAGDQGTVDTGEKSPQTGANLNTVAFGTVAALVVAAGVAVALRKKITE